MFEIREHVVRGASNYRHATFVHFLRYRLYTIHAATAIHRTYNGLLVLFIRTDGWQEGDFFLLFELFF
jgi:hypothetical protein